MNVVELFGRVGCVDSVMPAGKCLRVIAFPQIKATEDLSNNNIPKDSPVWITSTAYQFPESCR